jgi:hypothetical protein
MNNEILKQLLVLNNLIIQSFIEEDEPEVEETASKFVGSDEYLAYRKLLNLPTE